MSSGFGLELYLPEDGSNAEKGGSRETKVREAREARGSDPPAPTHNLMTQLAFITDCVTVKH